MVEPETVGAIKQHKESKRGEKPEKLEAVAAHVSRMHWIKAERKKKRSCATPGALIGL